MKRIKIKALILITLFCVIGNAQEVETKNPMVVHPEKQSKKDEIASIRDDDLLFECSNF